MMPSRFSNAVVLLILLTTFSNTGCKRVGDAERGLYEADDSTAAVEAITAQSRRFSDAYVRGDLDALLSIYTTDGVAAPGGRDFIRGRPALDSLWALPEGRTILRHAATPIEIVVDGDHAYDWGYYEGEAAQDGESLGAFRGKYLIVWQRGEDGTWRMAVDMWSAVPRPDPEN